MKKIYLKLFSMILVLSLIFQISALDFERENRINFGHVVRIQSLNTIPAEISPGELAILNITLRNSATFEINDIMVQINLPNEINFLNDVSKIKLAKLSSGESNELHFQIIPLPGISEGIYNTGITIDYVNFIGDERQDNDSFGILVKSTPKLFIKAESSNIYGKGDVGEISLTFVNNDVGDIKFLTIELLESDNYAILSTNKEYIGDLDSDDFESVDFKIRLKTKQRKITLPLIIDYRDALNKEYHKEISANLNILTAKEAGKKTTSTLSIIIWLVILGGLGYGVYKKYFKKKKLKK